VTILPLPALSIPELQAQISGRIIAPDDPDYEQARTVMYGGPDARPAVIVRVANATGTDGARA
jgi:hypothetical protein